MKIILFLLRSAVILIPCIAFMIYYNLRMETKRFEPHIYTIRGGKVLVAKIKGDPETTLDAAGITLYNAGRRLKLSPSYISARHLKWNQRETVPRRDWIVYYSRLVPETAISPVDKNNPVDVSVFYDRHRKTEVAEIHHVGRYEEIPESLEKLRKYIENQGYRLDGFYEEVYLVFEKIESNPDKYETLLRYQVTQ